MKALSIGFVQFREVINMVTVECFEDWLGISVAECPKCKREVMNSDIIDGRCTYCRSVRLRVVVFVRRVLGMDTSYW